MFLSLNYRSYCHELEVQLQVQIDFHRKLQECLEQKIFKQYSATTSHGNLVADKRSGGRGTRHNIITTLD